MSSQNGKKRRRDPTRTGDSIIHYYRNKEAAAVLANVTEIDDNPLAVLSYLKQGQQNGASPRRKQTQSHQNGHRLQVRESFGTFLSNYLGKYSKKSDIVLNCLW